MSLLSETHPDLHSELSELNQLSTANITTGSGLKLLWVCSENHTYEARVFNRVKGSSCPYCKGQLPIAGQNDLQTLYPEIWKHLVNSETILPKSKKIVEWKCNNQHIIRRSPKSLVDLGHFFCAECPVEVVNPLSNYPDLLSSFSRKNEELPSDISVSSSKKYNWECQEGHEWSASPKNRKHGRGCPKCAGRTTEPVHITHPILKEIWNDPRPIENFSYGSATKVTWKCDKKHSWESTISNRIDRNSDKVKPCPICSNKIVIPGVNTFDVTHNHLLKDIKNLDDKELTVTAGSTKRFDWICELGHEWNSEIRSRALLSSGCPKCLSSEGEKQLSSFIISLVGEENLVTNTRKVISPYELDIYVPSKKIAIEYNGIYWHSDAVKKDKNYHYKKWLACKEQGIQLIQIWEDEWRDKQDIVKRLLTRKLGVDKTPSTYARSTKAEVVSKELATKFLNLYHIQGDANGSIRLGLLKDDQLLAVAVFKREPGEEHTFNLLRFATASSLPGGFSKLVNHLKREYDVRGIVTFSDNCISDGSLYANNSFRLDKSLAPDYRYLVKGKREHKFGYRLTRFINDDMLIYEPGLSEAELAKLNNISRIWDAGKQRWVLEV